MVVGFACFPRACVCFLQIFVLLFSWLSVKPKTKPNLVFQGGLSSVARVRVSVVDINDNRPAFYPVLYMVSLSTHSSPGTSVVKVTANDPDSGVNGRVTYRTVPGRGSAFFTLNKDTGTPADKHTKNNKGCMFISVFNPICVPTQALFLFLAPFTAKPTQLSPWR